MNIAILRARALQLIIGAVLLIGFVYGKWTPGPCVSLSIIALTFEVVRQYRLINMYSNC